MLSTHLSDLREYKQCILVSDTLCNFYLQENLSGHLLSYSNL